MSHKLRGKTPADEPVMSDLTILVSVEDLINIAMGPAEKNTINYKMIQTVLHILARQMRLLETKVDIKMADVADLRKKKKRHRHSSEDSTSDASPKHENIEETEKEKSLKGAKKKDKHSKDKEKDKDIKEKGEKKDKPSKEKYFDNDKESSETKEREKIENVTKEKEKQKKYKEQTSDYQDDSDSKETSRQRSKSIKEKELKVLEKMSPEEKASYNKQKEKEEQIMKNMSPKEKEKYLKEKEMELNELQEMTPKEKEKHLKEKEKELNTLEKMSSAEKEKYFKEKEKQKTTQEKETHKEKEKEEQKSTKEKETHKEKEKEEQKTTKEKEMDKEKEKEEHKSKKENETYKDKEKERKTSQKENEDKVLEKMSPKEEQLYLRQKEREEIALQKMSPKEKKKYYEEKEKEDGALERMSSKEREKYLQEKEEEAKALERMNPVEKEKYLTEQKKQTKAKSTGSGTSIAITEVERQKEKILIVEKGPTTRASKTRVGSIEVVTISQFNLLEAEVKRLKQTAAPLPMPALPDNKKLKADLVKGRASLTDTMQAMQVSARVQAAEAGLARMAGLLTQLAASGALPKSFAGQLEDAKAEMEVLRSDLKGEEPRPAPKGPSQVAQARKSVAIDTLTTTQSQPFTESGPGTSTGTRPSSAATGTKASSVGPDKRASVAAVSMASRHSHPTIGRPIAVTRNEMDDAIQSLRDDMTKSMQAMTYRASSSAETAAGTAKGISDKMEIALHLNTRISDLYALTSDYAEQLSGFDAGLTTQMQSFQEQMIQMRDDLKTGLVQLEMANNNAETAAVLELLERFNGLQIELEASLVEHHRLNVFQKQLGEELRGLVAAVETLKEQKADRDEVWDGLRDKADLAKLSGLLTEEEFALSRTDLDERLEACYKKFNRQEKVWMTAMKDLNEIIADKAEIMQLLSIKEDAQDQLRYVQERLRVLTLQLGEPKAAILTRLLSKDGKCGACAVPALMEAVELHAGKPHQLPALRPPPDGQPCVPDFTPIVMEDENTKSHICNRWVGGSHTLVSRGTPREVAPAQLAPAHPVKKYVGYGVDGKLYDMEEELQPCIECNKLTTDEEAGAGDTGPKVCDCWPGVETVKALARLDPE